MFAGSWVDITDRVRVADGIVIRRGFPEAGNSAEPSSISLTLDIRDGELSPRSRTGTWYGLFGRNPPVRVRIGDYLAGGTYMLLQGRQGNGGAGTANGATVAGSDHTVDLTGDIDVRFDAAL